MLTVNDKIAIPQREFDFEFVRSSGPGGQNVNKVATKAVLKWDVSNSTALPEDVKARFVSKYRTRIGKDGVLTLTSQRFRDRPRNVDDCLEKLRKMVLSVAERPVPRKKTKPTKGSRIRRRRDKEKLSQKKERRRPPRGE